MKEMSRHSSNSFKWITHSHTFIQVILFLVFDRSTSKKIRWQYFVVHILYLYTNLIIIIRFQKKKKVKDISLSL